MQVSSSMALSGLSDMLMNSLECQGSKARSLRCTRTTTLGNPFVSPTPCCPKRRSPRSSNSSWKSTPVPTTICCEGIAAILQMTSAEDLAWEASRAGFTASHGSVLESMGCCRGCNAGLPGPTLPHGGRCRTLNCLSEFAPPSSPSHHLSQCHSSLVVFPYLHNVAELAMSLLDHPNIVEHSPWSTANEPCLVTCLLAYSSITCICRLLVEISIVVACCFDHRRRRSWRRWCHC